MNESNAERLLREKVQGILMESLNEPPNTRMSGRVGVGPANDKSLLNIHNLRLIYDFSITEALRRNLQSYIKPDLSKTKGGSGATTARLVNNNTTYIVELFEGCAIWIKKNTAEVRYYPIKERWHYVDHGTQGKEQVIAIYRDCYYNSVDVLKRFIKIFGGSSRYNLLNMVHDGKIQGNDITTRIPKDMKFNSRHVKKVYAEQNIELHSPQDVCNFIENMGIREIVPSVCEAIEMLSSNILNTHPYQTLKMFTKSPHEVLNTPDYLRLMGLLTEHQRQELWDYWLGCVVDGAVCGCTGRRLK